MIVRIVKMTFDPAMLPSFLTFLSDYTSQIRASDGCTFLQVLRDIHHPEKLTTISHWESEAHLNAYRNSTLFKHVWSNTKIHFTEAPEASSFEEILS